MTKADQIRTLYAAGKSVKEICQIVGCSDSYVRTAARQRVGGRMSKHDAAYEPARRRIYSEYGDRAAARKAAAAARAAGQSWTTAYQKVLCETARRRAAEIPIP